MERNDIDIRLFDYWLVYDKSAEVGMETSQQLTTAFPQIQSEQQGLQHEPLLSK